jgi:hypothetical protein
MNKFERRRADLLQKHEEELRNLEEAQQKELRKKVDPVARKLGALVEEEARKILEKNPDILDGYAFKKRDSAKAMSAALEALFSDDEDEDEAGSDNRSTAPEKTINHPSPTDLGNGMTTSGADQ